MIIPQRNKIFATIFIATYAVLAGASGQNGVENNGLHHLETFIKTVKTGRSEFTQTVTQPAKEGRPERSKISSGHFEFLRPSYFRFTYKKPFEQSIVADGQTLWLYDPDLNQVTARKQAQALASTPAALIASAVDVKSLQNDFVLSPQPDSDGLVWVLATPKGKDNPLQSIRIGFRLTELAVLEMVDNFGQRSHLRFSKMEANPSPPNHPKLDAKSFQFTPPPSADVIRQ
ncbi:MAG: outer rane lipoprotein chaperone LolA [Pseudomonadota bacterium]|jgi:outer membrane lipoprotein carrier protein